MLPKRLFNKKPDEAAAAAKASAGVGRMQRLLVLRTFGPFAELPPEELTAVAEYTRERYFPKGGYIYREGQPVTAIQFIVHGEVELRSRGRKLRQLGPRSAVGGLGVFAREPEGYACIARENTTTLEISADDMRDIFEDHFPLLRATFRGLARDILDARREAGSRAGFPERVPASVSCPARALDLVERTAFLRRSMPFARTQIDALVELAREATEVRFDPAHRLWSQGEASDYALLLICGSVHCAVDDNGQRFELGAGDSVGSLDALADRPRSYTATTEEPVVALQIETETLYDVFEDHFEMATDFLRTLARNLLELYEEGAGDEGVSGEMFAQVPGGSSA
jgi:CRP-like cAMP-binding protein